jgi:hypothetical protein
MLEGEPHRGGGSACSRGEGGGWDSEDLEDSEEGVCGGGERWREEEEKAESSKGDARASGVT